jgi:hypothetical protein
MFQDGKLLYLFHGELDSAGVKTVSWESRKDV